MSKQMTLDKIRDELRSFSSTLAKLDGYAWAIKCSSWADAIDAAMIARESKS